LGKTFFNLVTLIASSPDCRPIVEKNLCCGRSIKNLARSLDLNVTRFFGRKIAGLLQKIKHTKLMLNVNLGQYFSYQKNCQSVPIWSPC
jgi:hypothetical protein